MKITKINFVRGLGIVEDRLRQENSKPKFYLIDKDEYIVLNIKNVELNEIYIIRYYPNTKIGEVVEKIS